MGNFRKLKMRVEIKSHVSKDGVPGWIFYSPRRYHHFVVIPREMIYSVPLFLSFVSNGIKSDATTHLKPSTWHRCVWSAWACPRICALVPLEAKEQISLHAVRRFQAGRGHGGEEKRPEELPKSR